MGRSNTPCDQTKPKDQKKVEAGRAGGLKKAANQRSDSPHGTTSTARTPNSAAGKARAAHQLTGVGSSPLLYQSSTGGLFESESDEEAPLAKQIKGNMLSTPDPTPQQTLIPKLKFKTSTKLRNVPASMLSGNELVQTTERNGPLFAVLTHNRLANHSETCWLPRSTT